MGLIADLWQLRERIELHMLRVTGYIIMIVDGVFNIQNIQISNGNSLKYSMDIELWNKKFIGRIDWQICWGGPDMFSNSLYTVDYYWQMFFALVYHIIICKKNISTCLGHDLVLKLKPLVIAGCPILRNPQCGKPNNKPSPKSPKTGAMTIPNCRLIVGFQMLC